MLSRLRSPLPANSAPNRFSAPSLVKSGAATAVAAAAIIGLSAGAANAAVVSPSAGTPATDLSAMSSNSSGVLDGSAPALDLSGQALTGPSPLAPPASPASHPASAAPVAASAQAAAAATAARASQQHPVRSHPGAAAKTVNSRPRARHHARARRAPARPYQIYDSVTPTAIPGGKVVATYATGPYAVPASHVAGRHQVLWIDVNGSDSHANALDVEPGDASPSSAANWAWRKLNADHNSTAIIYTMRSEWPATRAAIGSLPRWMQSHVRWWIADPTGYPHLVPGSNATQWYWGSRFDISMAQPGF
jgi:hypothetical protein